MAVYIPKNRLGSNPPPRSTSRPGSITYTIENLPIFQQLKESYAQSKANAASGMKEKYESNAEVQRWRTQMTKEERARDAIERMIPTTRAVQEMRNGGKEVSYEEARSKAEQIAYKAEAKASEKPSGGTSEGSGD